MRRKGPWALEKKPDGTWEMVREVMYEVTSTTTHTLRERRKLGTMTAEGARAAFRAFLSTKEAK